MVRTLVKGNAWRHKVATLLGLVGDVDKRGIGDPGDDLTVWTRIPGLTLSVECKDETRYSPAEWVAQAERQASRGRVPVVVAHRHAKAAAADGYVIMSGRTFVELLLIMEGES